MSKHLAPHNILVRESLGTLLCWRLGDDSIYGLCDLVCGSIAKRYEKIVAERAAFTATVS